MASPQDRARKEEIIKMEGMLRKACPHVFKHGAFRRMRNALIDAFGLRFCPSFLRDGQFYLALAIAPLPLIALNYLAPAWYAQVHARLFVVLSLVIWQPLIEELLFRGFMQGGLESRSWAQGNFLGLSRANYCTTLVFVAAHLVNHSILWALAVAVPSLVFGYFRDRHAQIYPSIILHAAYNACYLAIGSMQNNSMSFGA